MIRPPAAIDWAVATLKSLEVPNVTPETILMLASSMQEAVKVDELRQEWERKESVAKLVWSKPR